MLLKLFSWEIRNHAFPSVNHKLTMSNFSAYLTKPELSVKLDSPGQLFLFLMFSVFLLKSCIGNFLQRGFLFFLFWQFYLLSYFFFSNKDFGRFEVIKQFWCVWINGVSTQAVSDLSAAWNGIWMCFLILILKHFLWEWDTRPKWIFWI